MYPVKTNVHHTYNGDHMAIVINFNEIARGSTVTILGLVDVRSKVFVEKIN